MFKTVFSRAFVIFMLILFPLTMSSCSWFGEDAEHNDVIERTIQEKRTGTLKSLGGVSIAESTHLLEIKDGETIRLKSKNINLENDKYVNKKVEVRGYIGETEDNKKIMEVMSIDTAEDIDEDAEKESKQEVEYENPDLGFSIRYFDNWELVEENTGVVFKAPVPTTSTDKPESESIDLTEPTEEQDVISIRQIPNPDKESLEKYLNLPSDPNELITLGYVDTKVGVAQSDALRKQSSDKQEVNIYLPFNTYIYHFNFEGADNKDTNSNRNTFFSMISTFELIDSPIDIDEDSETDESPEQDLETDSEPDLVNDLIDENEINEKDEPVGDTEVSTSQYSNIAQKIAQSINSIAPESSENNGWKANKFEFTDPNYTYVEYDDGTEKRKVLLTYDFDGYNVDTSIVGYFEPGETTSWTRISGENPVAGEEKTVISLSDSGTTEKTVVQEGYRYFESLPYNFVAQYPSNWYYSGSSGSGEVLHRYDFSNEPLEDGNELVIIDIISGNMPSGTEVSAGPHNGIKVYENGEIAIYIQREDGRIYKIHAGTEHENKVIDMAASIRSQ